MFIGSVRRVWAISFGFAFVMGALWALATPLFGVPDEPSHISRAASVVRGELLGREPGTGDLPTASSYVRNATRFVEVPVLLDDAGEFDTHYAQHLPCFAFNPEQDASCQSFGGGDGSTGLVSTTAGEHPPGWYAVVGVPSLFSVEPAGLYAMRLLNVALTAALIASGIAAAWFGKNRLGGVGLLFALTPMVFFLAGGVNSSGPEIGAAIALWVGLVVMAESASPPSWLVTTAGIAAVVLAMTRRSGPLWVVLIVALVLAGAGSRRFIKKLSSGREIKLWGSAVVIAIGFQVIWMFAVGALPVGSSTSGGRSLSEAIQFSLGSSYQKLVKEAVGVFGWLDAPAPDLVVGFWLLAIGGLTVLALSEPTLRRVRAVALTAVLTLGTFVFFEALESNARFGFWQGRYSMPLAVGIPIVLAFAVSESLDTRLVMRFRWFAAVAFTTAHSVAFWQYLKRVTVGVSGTDRFLWQYSWGPPLPPLVLMVAYVAIATVGAVWLARMGSNPEGDVGNPVNRRTSESTTEP